MIRGSAIREIIRNFFVERLYVYLDDELGDIARKTIIISRLWRILN